MILTDFRDIVLFDPIKQGADHLKIVSGYASHTMASWHIKRIAEKNLTPIDITLIVGMSGVDGISIAAHDGFKGIMDRNGNRGQSNFTCQYVIKGVPVHSKLYVWERKGEPFLAFMGSANYSQAAFSPNRQKEVLQACDPIQALDYFGSIEPKTMYCDHEEIEDNIIIPFKSSYPILDNDDEPLVSVQGAGVEKVTLSLLTNKKDVGFGSGINWGHRPDGTPRNPNQMYISLPANTKKAHDGFFPIIGNPSGKGNPNFSVLTDDGVNLIFNVQQEGSKAITTPLDNSRIGEYFRSRMELPCGAFVTKKDLEDYGRTDVDFYKLDDEQYIMDFSV